MLFKSVALEAMLTVGFDISDRLSARDHRPLFLLFFLLFLYFGDKVVGVGGVLPSALAESLKSQQKRSNDETADAVMIMYQEIKELRSQNINYHLMSGGLLSSAEPCKDMFYGKKSARYCLYFSQIKLIASRVFIFLLTV